MVQHSATASIPVTNVFQGQRNISFFGDVENPNAGETRNGQAEDNFYWGGGSLSSDKQCGRFFFRGKKNKLPELFNVMFLSCV